MKRTIKLKESELIKLIKSVITEERQIRLPRETTFFLNKNGIYIGEWLKSNDVNKDTIILFYEDETGTPHELVTIPRPETAIGQRGGWSLQDGLLYFHKGKNYRA